MKPETNLENRITILRLFVILIISFYVIRLFSIQIIQGEQFRTKAKNISQKTTRIPAQRGEIFDRNVDTPLVVNADSFAVNVVPREIPAKEFQTVITKLSKILHVSPSYIEEKIPPEIRKSFQITEIKKNLNYNTIVELAENLSDLPGVSWQAKPIRNYLATRSFSHIIGYVDDITREELKSYYNKGYAANSLIGKSGIEKTYDEVLRGKDGSSYRTVDAKGQAMKNLNVVNPPKMGNNLVLTIDRRIQTLAEKALGPRIGAAIVLQAGTGEVLALVSYPFFDQNIFLQEDARTQYVKLLKDPTIPLLNRAVNANYPPASTFKIAMSTAILAEGSIDPSKEVTCPGEIIHGDRLFRCHIRKPGHGKMNLKTGLAQSCDIYYWTVCRDYLGIDKMLEYIDMFGFGHSAEIDLPSQTSGLVPTKTWKERQFHEKWLDGDTMNLAIGQGYMLASPLQVANMAAFVINDGIIYKPHLVKEIREPQTNKIIKKIEPEILHKADIPAHVFTQMRADMRYVITNGTPQYSMRNKTVELAGKTGTAEVGFDDRWHSWMLAYGPYSDEKNAIVVAVLVEATNPWEWWAPYATNIIFQGIYANQTYEEAVKSLGFSQIPGTQRRQE